MAAANDFLLDKNGDLLFANGDLVTGPSDVQHIQDTINAFPGWWKEFPPDGVGIRAYIKSSGRQQELARQVRLQLQSDGYSVGSPKVNISTDSITLNPNAIRI